MATNNVVVEISAKNQTAAGFGEARRGLRELSREAQQANQQAAGPAVKPRFDAVEQEIRDRMAGTVKAMREGAMRANIQEQVKSRLFGEPAPEAPGLSAGDFRRGEMSQAGQIRLRQQGLANAMEENEKSLREQAREFRGTVRFFSKLGGVGLLADMVGRQLQELPAETQKYREALKAGATKTEVFATALSDNLPVIGNLAKGFRSLLDVASGEAAEAARKDELKAARESFLKATASNEKRRDEAVRAAMGEGQGARARLRLGGLTGDARDAEQARIDRDKKLREAADVENSAKPLGDTKAQDQIRKQAALMRQAAESELQDELNRIASDRGQKMLDDDKERRETHKRMDEEAKRARDEMQRAQFIQIKSAARHREDIDSATRAFAFGDVAASRSTSGLATAQRGGLLTGVAEASQARRSDDPNLKKLESIDKNMAQARDYLKAVASQFNPGMNFAL